VSEPSSEYIRVQKFTIVALALAVTIVFAMLIWNFVLALLLAAVFSGAAYPAYCKVLAWLRGRRGMAAGLTLVTLLLIVFLPMLILLNLVATQAYELSQAVIPWMEAQMQGTHDLQLRLPDWVPFREAIPITGPEAAAKMGELVGKAGGVLVSGLSAATMGTAAFFLRFFVLLYAMFYFLKEGPELAAKVLDTAPLPRAAKVALVEKGLSVTRATIKGTLVIGLIQGALGGLSFAVAGIEGAAFWGALMAVASVIPSVGTAIVWVPAVTYLFLTGDTTVGIALTLWNALIVGSVDNLLRPVLVGGDTQMPDILILVSTLGGLGVMGIPGLVVGPVIAALFVTMWDIYSITFQDSLPDAEAVGKRD
jgi:predicted PurR-regulated permease PerM